MRIIRARNAHNALVDGISLLHLEGLQRSSRNGAVRVAPWPVVTEFHAPSEKVVFHPQRDTNIAFLIYEAFWMLQGRRDLEPLTRYVKGFGRYSDDGKTLHGAYGDRWRRRFDFDQLSVIIDRLKTNSEDRRSVLAMWDANLDLSRTDARKDVPCNTTATFQRYESGKLDLTVFCRSNDIIWGTYFANAFHFATLLEYMAAHIGCQVGIYRQISVNYHAYEDVYQPLLQSMADNITPDPYTSEVNCASLAGELSGTLDLDIEYIMANADASFPNPAHTTHGLSVVMQAAYNVLRAHHVYRSTAAPERFSLAIEALNERASEFDDFQNIDWIVAMRRWIDNRFQIWDKTMLGANANRK